MIAKKFFLYLLPFLTIPGFLPAQENLDSLFSLGHQKEWSIEMTDAYYRWADSHFLKPTQGKLRQDAIMNGNKITSIIWNYGSISRPGERVVDIVWEGLGYAYEFGPFFASETQVLDDSHPDTYIKLISGDTTYWAHIISDGLISRGGEVSPDNTQRWGFEPLSSSDDGFVEYSNTTQDKIPTSDDKDRSGDGKPDSWPEGWYNPDLRDYVWPGALGQGATNADKEAFYVFDDINNIEFEYYPYIGDTLRKGLGLEVEARIYQWANVDAEDAIFLIYKIRNKSDKDLPKVIFGMWGDPHIGGPDDYRDDLASFDTKLEMVFAWDEDDYSINNPNIIPGYLGYKFLESPGLDNDFIDNDEDGMVDESWTDGDDNDGDWNVETDDVGIDGIPNTGDEGEKDGSPTAGDPFDIRKPGEPNFEFTDIDESDMIGLTSFAQPLYSGLNISEDERIWAEQIQPDHFDSSEVQGDYVFLYASGIFPLKSVQNVPATELSQAIKRFSIALLIGEDRNDLVLNAKTVQRIYNSGYQFAKPPAKPNLTVVPGDQKVSLYWDNVAELSVDPITKEKDFEGYVIYRSTDPKFLDQQTITDIYGNKFLFEPLKTAQGASAKFDIDNDYSGPSNIPYTGRGLSYYLGDNVGLRNVFVDSNSVINGQTYFYAVVSYDHGSDSLGLPPSECAKIITYDPTTDVYTFDINTAKVIPRKRAAGYVPSEIVNQDINYGIVRENGFSTGVISVDIIDEMAVEDDNEYLIKFEVPDTLITMYSVEDLKPIEDTFVSFYDNFVKLTYKNLNSLKTIISSVDGGTVFEAGVDYQLDASGGAIKVFDPNTVPGARMEDNTEYAVTYTYHPLWQSMKIDSQLTNPPFNGVRLVVRESEFAVNESLTDWSSSSNTNLITDRLHPSKTDPYDYEFRFSSQIEDTAVTGVTANFTIWDVVNNQKMDFAITEVNMDGTWGPEDIIFILRGGLTPENIVWEIILIEPESDYVPPTDGDIFYLGTDKPFAEGDLFSFQTVGVSLNKEKAKSEMDKIAVVPNPYVATNLIEELNPLNRSSRGYRRLYFDHLPQKCTIRIFTMSGELIQTLEHNSALDDGKEFWDLLTKDNMEVAYGLYFFHVEAPGIGEKTGKFAIIK